MKKILLFSLVTIGAFAIFSSCSQGSSSSNDTPDTPTVVEGSDATQIGNARSIIKGSQFGGATTPTMKSVTLECTNSLTGITVPSSAYVIKDPTDNGFYVLFDLENTGNAAYAFLETTNVYFYDSNNAQLNAAAKTTYIYGNVGFVSTSIYTNTCLFPSQKGLALLYDSNNYSAIARISMALSTNTTAPTNANAELKATSFKYSDNTLSIKFLDSGSTKLDISDYLFYAVRNAQNIPIGWGFFDKTTISPSTGNIEVGAEGSISTNIKYTYYANYPLTAVDVCFNYAPFTTTGSGSARSIVASQEPANSRAIDELRNQHIKEIENALQ
jgi:hypothetical protein